jgi:hypothetical protein
MKRYLLPAVLVTLGAIGCAQRIYDVKLDRSLFLDTEPGQTVYLRTTNTSSLQDYPIGEDIRAALQAKGYRLTDDRSTADVVMRVNIRYTGLMEEAIRGGKIAGGAATGGVVGGLATAAGGASRSGTAAGALGGMLVGAGLGYWLESRELQNTFVTVVDFQILETKINEIKSASIYARVRDKGLTAESAAERVRSDIARQIAGQF